MHKHHQIQFGPKESVEAVGHGGFYAMHGIDLLAEAQALAKDWGHEEEEARRGG